jgi:hypothetical protein
LKALLSSMGLHLLNMGSSILISFRNGVPHLNMILHQP